MLNVLSGAAQRLRRDFFGRDTHVVAKDLLGKLLIRQWRKNIFIVRINEVESYVGDGDLACHAAKGKTKRNKIMFGEAGHTYVYMIYGMYYCLNVVTERKGYAAAVLIRGGTWEVRSDAHEKYSKTNQLLNGPGKLSRALHIQRAQNALDLTQSHRLYLASDGLAVSPIDIKASPRIGVAYAGKDALLPWRYYLAKDK